MDFTDNGGIPPQLEATRRRFEQWRQKRQGRCPIPDSLWAPAVKMARIYGVCRTAKVLRLGYYALKKRLEQQTPPPAAPAEAGGTTFLELPALPRAASGECVLELEEPDGAKKRVHVKGLETPELATLIRSFWES
jgi:hypothetical protein